MKEINRRSSIDLIIGDTSAPEGFGGFATNDFEIMVTSGKPRPYCERVVASYRGGELDGCTLLPDGGVRIAANHHHLGCGELWITLSVWRDDPGHPDGRRRDVWVWPSGVKLVEVGPDAEDSGAIEVNPAVAYLTAYDLAVKGGYTGTLEDYTAAMSELPAIAAEVRDTMSRVAVTDTANVFEQPQTFNGDVVVNGELIQRGEHKVTHAEDVYTTNDVIHLRSGAVAGLGEGELAGFTAENYDGENVGELGFDRGGNARVGDVGDAQPLLTRAEAEEIPDGAMLVWQAGRWRAVGVAVKTVEMEVTYDDDSTEVFHLIALRDGAE